MFGYGGRLVMAGLDVTHQFQATPERIARIAPLPGTLAAVFADLFDFFSGNYLAAPRPCAPGAAVHDPLAVLALTHPRAVRSRSNATSTIETRGEFTRGHDHHRPAQPPRASSRRTARC